MMTTDIMINDGQKNCFHVKCRIRVLSVTASACWVDKIIFAVLSDPCKIWFLVLI